METADAVPLRSAATQRAHRKEQSAQKEKQRRRRNTEAQRRYRAALPPEKKTKIREDDTKAHREHLDQLSSEAREETYERRAEAHRVQYANLPPAKKLERQQRDAAEHDLRRHFETKLPAFKQALEYIQIDDGYQGLVNKFLGAYETFDLDTYGNDAQSYVKDRAACNNDTASAKQRHRVVVFELVREQRSGGEEKAHEDTKAKDK
mmetsp:Transcript_29473/g.90187  ORF Transcript_29473/g.90187 Transcript_29473/m.90187 type:complete len:206 (-) Transcript_29473:197-814(-)